MRTILLSALILVFAGTDLYAQLYSTTYRAPGQDWQELRSERFRVIYPAAYRDLAYETLTILELDYNDIQDLVGGSLRDFPVILNAGNDASNGFVASFNFRSEVEIAQFKGKAMNPKSGSWFETVLPHELVHALHLSNSNPNTISGSMGIFSKDIERSFHTAAPLGILEGIAVEHESHNTMPQSGRGNHAFFTNQFNALLDTPGEWSMGQLVQTTTYTPPFNRHYVGGYTFINWLQNEYGDNATRDAIEWHHKHPWFGFGMALRRTTGKSTSALYKEFSADQKEREEARRASLDNLTEERKNPVEFRASCRNASRPVWLDNDRVLFYGSTCNRTTGFYLWSESKQETIQVYEVGIVGDVSYGLNHNRTKLLYSRYHPDPLFDNQFKADIHELNLITMQSRRITNGARVVSPRYGPDGTIYALQTTGQRQQLVEIDSNGSVHKSYRLAENSSVIEIDVHPDQPNKLAILGRLNGVQAVWFESLPIDDPLFSREPDLVSVNGSIYDPHWHPDGNKLLYTSDGSGTMNIYQKDLGSSEVVKLTESMFNAMEASYSPGSGKLALISQRKNEQLPFTTEFDSLNYEITDRSDWVADSSILERMNRPLLNRDEEADTSEWSEQPYRTGYRWLIPRYRVPFIESISPEIDRLALNLSSADPLSSHSYTATSTMFASRLWYDVTYRNTSFYPGFKLRVFDQPNVTAVNQRFNDTRYQFPTNFTQRGVTLSIPFRYRFEQNVRTTALLVEPEYSVRQLQFARLSDARKKQSNAVVQHTIGLNTTINLRLKQNRRDLQPNSGIVFFNQLRSRLNEEEIVLDFGPGTGGPTPLLQRHGIRTGVITYISPLKRFNQSLRISAQTFSQSSLPIFNNTSIYSSYFRQTPLPGIHNVGVFDTRYTIPLIYPDDGGLFVPAYLSNIYMVLFSQTVGNLTDGGRTLLSDSNTVVGAGIRSRVRLSNLAFDVGIAFGWDIGLGQGAVLIGNF